MQSNSKSSDVIVILHVAEKNEFVYICTNPYIRVKIETVNPVTLRKYFRSIHKLIYDERSGF